MVAWKRPGSRVAQDVLSDRCLREGVEAEPVAFAKDLQRCELFLAKHGDDPIQSDSPPSSKIRSEEINICRSTHTTDTSGYCLLVTHYYKAGSAPLEAVRLRGGS